MRIEGSGGGRTTAERGGSLESSDGALKAQPPAGAQEHREGGKRAQIQGKRTTPRRPNCVGRTIGSQLRGQKTSIPGPWLVQLRCAYFRPSKRNFRGLKFW
jgi:hypothetical protein